MHIIGCIPWEGVSLNLDVSTRIMKKGDRCKEKILLVGPINERIGVKR